MKKTILSLYLQRYLSKFLVKRVNLTHTKNFYYSLNKDKENRNLIVDAAHTYPLTNSLSCADFVRVVEKKVSLSSYEIERSKAELRKSQSRFCKSKTKFMHGPSSSKKMEKLQTFFNFNLFEKSLKNQIVALTLKRKTFCWPSRTRHKQISLFLFDSLNIKNVQLIRPLFSITRLDTFYICKTLKLPVYPDKTNLSIAFLRNRARKQILPSIRILLNPQFDTLMCKFNDSYLN